MDVCSRGECVQNCLNVKLEKCSKPKMLLKKVICSVCQYYCIDHLAI